MLAIAIPGFRDLSVEHLVCDFNGTLAQDGRLLPGVHEALATLSSRLRVHVVTADTHGGAAAALADLQLTLHVVPPMRQAAEKRAYVERLGASSVVAIGNGRNDVAMLEVAALGIAVAQAEGAASAVLASADVVTSSIGAALDLLLRPQRLVATLRE
jgi:P-type E1-E2 ATPase